MPIEIEPFNLSDIKASYQLTMNGPHRILVVAFRGEYRVGSAGNDDAYFMHAVASAGVEARGPSAIILDFSDLKYVWGDMLERVYDAAPQREGSGQTFAVVVGKESREALRTLELGELSNEPITTIPWIHENLEAAFGYLISQMSA